MLSKIFNNHSKNIKKEFKESRGMETVQRSMSPRVKKF